MSLKSIYLFQSKLYEKLSSVPSLPRIYLSVQQDAKHPFILMNLLKAHNISEHDVYKYEIDFEICVFGRDKSQESILEIATNISAAIDTSIFNNENSRVLGIKVYDLEWIRGHDLMTMKLVISYKALLECM